MTERLDRAIAALRRLAIVDVHDTGVQRLVVVGSRCRVCLFSWRLHGLEVHAVDCPLEGTRNASR